MTQQPQRNDSGQYVIDGSPLPSVTHIISAELDKPGLERWKERTDDWREIRDRKALIGSLAHRRILNEYSIRDLPIEEVPANQVDPELLTDVEVACALWDDVTDELPITDMAHIEKTLWSTEFGYAGTADMISESTVIDLKTSSAVRESHKLQAAAYANAARERGIADVYQAAIVKCDPDSVSSGIEWLDREQLDVLFERFVELVSDYNGT